MNYWVLALALVAAPAAAQGDEPRFCPQRPSLGASACTTEPGQAQLEASALDWTLTRSRTEREDAVVFADATARIGIGPRSELQVGWTTAGTTRTRDRVGGTTERDDGVGDVTLGWRQALARPDGGGLSYGLQPFVTLPVGRMPVGAGDWSAGIALPITYDLTDELNLQFTGEVDAAVDADGDGRHLAYSGILGLARTIGERVTVAGELLVERDRDPAGHETRALAAGSIAWRPGRTWQLDLLAAAGLTSEAPDFRLILGGAVLVGRRRR